MGSFYPIQKITVGSGGQLSIAFTNIPQTYAHLLLRVSGQSERTAGNSDDLIVQFNSSTSGYSDRILFSNASTAYTSSDVMSGNKFDLGSLNQFGSKFSLVEIFIPNYTNSQNKVVMSDAGGPSDVAVQNIYRANGTLSNTAAITSITLTGYTGLDIAQYSTATLYGISNS